MQDRLTHLEEALVRALHAARRLVVRLLIRFLSTPRVQRGIGAALVFGLFALASAFVRTEVEADARYRVDRDTVRRMAPPAGLAPIVLEDLASVPQGGRFFSAYDESAIAHIARGYESLPWVARVRDLTIAFPGTLRFDLAIRRPAALLLSYLVDDEGTVLAPDRYAPNDAVSLRLPVLVNAPIDRRTIAPGVHLDHVAIRHGIAVAHALGSPAFDRLFQREVTIDVSNVDGVIDSRRSEIVVRAGQAVVEWGRSPISARQDVPLDAKLEKLRLVLARRPGLVGLSLVRLQLDDLEWR